MYLFPSFRYVYTYGDFFCLVLGSRERGREQRGLGGVFLMAHSVTKILRPRVWNSVVYLRDSNCKLNLVVRSVIGTPKPYNSLCR